MREMECAGVRSYILHLTGYDVIDAVRTIFAYDISMSKRGRGLSTINVNFITGVLNVVGKMYSKILAFFTKLNGITSTVVNIYVCTVSKEL
jgi:hypothetical protein